MACSFSPHGFAPVRPCLHDVPINTEDRLGSERRKRLATERKDAVTKTASWDQVERATGIEPALEAWEAPVLPLNYARVPLNYTPLGPQLAD